jgi:hypothetical protein
MVCRKRKKKWLIFTKINVKLQNVEVNKYGEQTPHMASC